MIHKKKNNTAQVNSKLNRSRKGKSDTGRLKDSERERVSWQTGVGEIEKRRKNEE